MLGVLLILATAIFMGVKLRIIATKSKDPLHPAFLFGVPLDGIYIVLPLLLLFRESVAFYTFLSEDNFRFVAAVNAIGVVSLILGLQGPSKARSVPPLRNMASENSRLFTMSLIFGAISNLRQPPELLRLFGCLYYKSIKHENKIKVETCNTCSSV